MWAYAEVEGSTTEQTKNREFQCRMSHILWLRKAVIVYVVVMWRRMIHAKGKCRSCIHVFIFAFGFGIVWHFVVMFAPSNVYIVIVTRHSF